MKSLSEQRANRQANVVIALGMMVTLWLVSVLFAYEIEGKPITDAVREVTIMVLRGAAWVLAWLVGAAAVSSAIWGVAWAIERIIWPMTEAERREKSDGTRLEPAAGEQGKDE